MLTTETSASHHSSLGRTVGTVVTLLELVESGVKLTPMMEQYYNIKRQHPETLLLFRMGDFYEVFFEDAHTASKILNITLTHRGKLGDTPVPMAGIPHHAALAYVDRLTQAGLRVAICEQIQDPKEAQGIVQRAVTQVVSPGLPFDLDRQEQGEQRFILCATAVQGNYYIIAMDFTTGAFNGHVANDKDEFLNLIKSYQAKEFLQFPLQWQDEPELEHLFTHSKIFTTSIRQEYFSPDNCKVFLEKVIPQYLHDRVIQQNPDILGPIGAIAYYICTTQQLDSIVHLNPFTLAVNQELVRVSSHTLKGLEILPRNKEQYRESLLGYLDRCVTSMGPRLLHQFFLSPLRKLDAIDQRLNWVEWFINQPDAIKSLRTQWNDMRDIDRICTKISTKKISSSDLLNLMRSLDLYFGLRQQLNIPNRAPLSDLSEANQQAIQKILESIRITINSELGASLEKGNLILPGANKSRDRLAKLAKNADGELLKLEEKYRSESGISKLKIKSNNVTGFFIEVSKGQLDKVPKHFQRRQTLVNAERFVTKELEDFEKDVLSAKAKLEKIEKEIFQSIVSQVAQQISAIKAIALNIATIDIFQSLAWISLNDNMSRPQLFEDKRLLCLKGAWHPLIKSQLHEAFTAHDLNLNEKQFFGLITGPNMAGKTTVMREAAIIQFMAQIGCYVPAIQAQLGICDQIFSRLGASDDIQRGQSTFMVEMTETAEILRHATDRSLIILDEVGRGTSTYDGLSIAWGLVEYFVSKVKGITLFATHYHELIELAELLPEAKNLTVKTVTENGNVHFLYELIEEGAQQSFGLYVAKLAGLPRPILKKAKEVLEVHEKMSEQKTTPTTRSKSYQLSFFEQISAPSVPEYLSQIEHDLASLDLFKMTPIDAMVKLREYQQKVLQ